jgi:hypothetical protein
MSYNFNIPAEIIDLANSNGLDLIGTGGGCDYVYRELAGGKVAVLLGIEDPQVWDVNEPCHVTVFEDDNWDAICENTPFPNVLAGMEYMKTL